MFPEYGCSSPVVSIDSEQSYFSLEWMEFICLCRLMHYSFIIRQTSRLLLSLSYCEQSSNEHSGETISVAGYLVLWVYSKCYEWSHGRPTVSFLASPHWFHKGCTSCSPNSGWRLRFPCAISNTRIGFPDLSCSDWSMRNAESSFNLHSHNC